MDSSHTVYLYMMGPSKTFQKLQAIYSLNHASSVLVWLGYSLLWGKKDTSSLPLTRHLTGILEGHDKVGRQRNAACQRVWVFGGSLTCLACSPHGETTGAGGAHMPPPHVSGRHGSLCSRRSHVHRLSSQLCESVSLMASTWVEDAIHRPFLN